MVCGSSVLLYKFTEPSIFPQFCLQSKLQLLEDSSISFESVTMSDVSGNNQQSMGNEKSVENVVLCECPMYILNLCQTSCQRFYTPESLVQHAELVSSPELLILLAEEYKFLKELEVNSMKSKSK